LRWKPRFEYRAEPSIRLYIRWRVIAIFCGGNGVMEEILATVY